jgi:predicted amidohydrolase YtcJ
MLSAVQKQGDDMRTRGLSVSMRAMVAAAVFAGTGALASESPAVVFFNAHVFTADYLHPYANAVAIRDDKIIAVGDIESVQRTAGADARRVDLNHKFLMPGMIDAHAHPIFGGLTLIQADFPDTEDSIPALVEFVQKQIDQKTSIVGDVLVVNGLDIGYWSHAAEIDAALSAEPFAKQPIVLFGSDGHTAWANAAARERAGITTDFIRGLSKDQQRYFGFEAGFKPNGFVVDVGKNKIDKSMPPPSAETMLAAGEAAVHYMNGLGITGWLDAAATGAVGGATPATVDDTGVLPVYKDLARHGELTAHVVAYPVVRPDSGLKQIDVVESLREQFKDIPNLAIPGLKVFADGVVEIPSQTAALTRPYRNTGHSSPLLFTPKKMNELVIEADRRGLMVHVHALGDMAVKATLDAFAAARKANPSGTLPFTLTHAQFVDPEDFHRFAPLNVIAALQLLWAVADPSTNEQVKPYVDPSIYRWMYPARSLLEAGTVIAGASDWPVSSANPFAAMYQAELRTGPQGVLDADQRVPRMAMLYAYTRNSAAVLNQGDRIGSLEVGKTADLVLVDRDITTVPVEELKEAKVLWTMLGGRVVYGTPP